jgi:hypothetical protein
MQQQVVLAIYRAPRFSPNSVQVDRDIMDAVCERLEAHSFLVEKRLETELENVTDLLSTSAVLTMGRLPHTLRMLETAPCRVINSSASITLCCHRSALNDLLRTHHLRVAPQEGSNGYWLKRGAGSAESIDDVVFCADRQQLSVQMQRFRERGMTDLDISAHQLGDVVKFYGVAGTSFFRHYYPSDGGRSKFGQEGVNGIAHHYQFDAEALQAETTKVAMLTGALVYGGDAVVHADGSFHLIDFNDWPSFSRCREDAAEAIASLIYK